MACVHLCIAKTRLAQEGSWGASTMAKPSIMCIEDQPLKSAHDARILLNNGKHVVQALKSILANGDVDTILAEEWCVEDLADTLTKGLFVDFVEYPSDDRDAQVAMQVLSHEQDQNKFRPSSIGDKVSITMRMHAKSKGGDWGVTTNTLMSVLGANRRSTAYRWVCLARDMDQEVLNFIKQQRAHLPGIYIQDNKYFLGRGESGRFKLNVQFACVALARLIDALDGGRAVTGKDFVSDYCVPFKHLETWQKAQITRFGVVAQEFPAFHRVVRSLQTEQGRQKLMLCLNNNVPISGTPSSDNTIAQQYGVHEARSVVDEMQKMKAGMDPKQRPAQNSGVSLGASDEAVASEDNPASEPVVAGAGLAEDDFMVVTEPKPDPIILKVRELVEAEERHIKIHKFREDFKRDVETRLIARKMIIIVDAPSSKAKVVADLFKFAQAFGQQSSSFLIPVGSRTELLSQVMTTVSKAMPKRALFVVQFGKDLQTVHRRCSFAVYMPPIGSTEAVPCFVSLTGIRAKASEGLRMRCVDPKCPMRCEGEEEGDPEAANADLHDDDQEFGEADPRDAMEEDDFDEAELALGMMNPVPQQGKLFIRNLFPFASPVAVHAQILHQLLKPTPSTHLLVCTRSAHPGWYVAARELKLECTALVEGAREHCCLHGQDLLTKMLMAKKYASAKELVGVSTSGVKRVRASTLPIIAVMAPPPVDQTIQIRDVDPSPSSAWRWGFNKNPQDLEEKMINLLSSELIEFNLYLDQTTDKSMGLFTQTARREGERLCLLRSLLFDTLTALESFLSEGGNKILSDRIVRVSNVVLEDTDRVHEVGEVYAALVGVGRFLQHFVGVRKAGPNTFIRVRCDKGAGDGFLELVVSTRNGAGIAARSQVVLNFGSEFDLSFRPDMDEAGAKKFRGALDKYFERASQEYSGVSLETQSAQEEAAKKKEEEEAKKRKEEEAKKRKEEDEATKNEEQAKRKKDQAKKKEDAKKQVEDAKRMEEEAKKKDDEGELKKTEAEAKKKEAEGAKQAQKIKKEEELEAKKKKDEEEAKRQQEEEEGKKRLDATCFGVQLSHVQSPFAYKIMFQEGVEGSAAAVLRIVSEAVGNKKIPPKTLLWSLKGSSGALKPLRKHQPALTWYFASTKQYLGPTHSDAHFKFVIRPVWA